MPPGPCFTAVTPVFCRTATPQKACFAADHNGAEALEAFNRIVRRDRRNDPLHMRVYRREVDQRLDRGDAEGRGIAHCMCHLGRSEQRF